METINVSQLANLLNAIKTCSPEWADKHNSVIDEMEKCLPHGSGIDGICEIDRENSTKDKIIINFEYHHMNDGGYYDGWTDHKLILTPSFIGGYDMKITGRDRNQTKDYLYDLFSSIFTV